MTAYSVETNFAYFLKEETPSECGKDNLVFTELKDAIACFFAFVSEEKKYAKKEHYYVGELEEKGTYKEFSVFDDDGYVTVWVTLKEIEVNLTYYLETYFDFLDHAKIGNINIRDIEDRKVQKALLMDAFGIDEDVSDDIFTMWEEQKETVR